MTNKMPTFTETGLKFLKKLKRNNNREWFREHKNVYEESVRRPMIELVNVLAERFEDFAPEAVADPKTSLFRIYRDTRFSKDKSPYKTYVAASFPVRGLGKNEGAGFYFHIGPSELLIAGGVYRPMPDDLRSVRDHVALRYKRLDSIVTARQFRRMFGELTGDRLSRTPRGFPVDHPADKFLRHKDFLAERLLDPVQAIRPDFVVTLVETFRAMRPLIQFLNEPLLRRRRIEERRSAVLRG
jgi:uncharacterized protein (TIGR02453 family)